MTDPYAPLAAVYDAWQDAHGPFWRLVLPRLEAILPAGTDSFLELGCGTGSLLLALREHHPAWRLSGTDGSAAMLARARARPGAATMAWQHASFTDDIHGPPFGAGGAFFDALNHARPDELALAFRTIAAALRPGAPFIFDLNNRLGFESWWQGRRVYPCPGFTLVIEATFDGSAAVARTTVHHQNPRGTTETTEVREWCFEEADVARALDAAGFVVDEVAAWAPRANDAPGKNWWVTRRR